MADNSVNIVGIGPDVLKEALSGVPPWATEKTADRIAGLLKKSYDKQSELLIQAIKCCGGGNLSAAEIKKTVDELGRLSRTVRNQNAEAEKSLKITKEKRDADKETLMGGRKLRGLGEKLNYVMGGLAIAGAKVRGVMTDYLDVYDSMYKSGINVLNGNDSTVDGFEALNQTVILTGLRLQTLQEIAEKYTSSINAAGFQKFARATASSTKQLELLGYSAKEGAELIASLMEAETGFSDIRGKSAQDIAADAIRLGSQFGKLSQTVGISRQQLLDNLKATAKSSDSTLVAAKWGAEAAENVGKAAAGLKDANLREAFTKMAASANPVFTQVYKDLQQSGLGSIADQMGQLAIQMRTMDPVEFARRVDALQQSIPRGGIVGLADQEAGGNASARAALEVVAGLQQQGRIVSQATQVQQDGATNTERSLAALQTQTEKFSALTQAAFYPMIEQVDIATKYLRMFNDAVYGAIDSRAAETRSWVGVGVAIAGVVGSLWLLRGALTTFVSLFGGGAGAAAAGGAGALGKLASGLGALLNPMTKLAAAGAAGYAVGTGIHAGLEQFETGQKILDGIGSLVAHTAAAFGSEDAQAAINANNRSSISVPKSPMPSTINSPSAVSAPQPKPDSTAGVLPPDGSQGGGPAIPRPGANADINNLLSYQGSVLERILLSTNDLVSVNKDILRYARNQ